MYFPASVKLLMSQRNLFFLNLTQILISLCNTGYINMGFQITAKCCLNKETGITFAIK